MVNNIRVKMFFKMLVMISLFAWNEMMENKITIEGLFQVPLQ